MPSPVAPAIELLGGATWEWNVTTQKLTFSAGLADLMGVDPDAIRTIADIVSISAMQDETEDDLSNAAAIQRLIVDPIAEIASQQPYSLYFLTVDGHRWLWLRAYVVIDVDGVMSYVRGQLDDATALLRSAHHAKQQARIDKMTGLLRKESFDQEVVRWLESLDRYDGAFLVYVNIDLDKLKSINTKYGHDGGDEVLSSFGSRLKTLEGPDVIAGRPGGDEFALVARCHTSADYEVLVEFIVEASTFTHEFSVNIAKSRQPHAVTSSVGIATLAHVNDPIADALSLSVRSDMASYEAKRHRDGRPVVWTPELAARIDLESHGHVALARHLEDSPLPLAWMPIADVKTGRILGAELLLDDSTRDKMGLATNEELIRMLETIGLLDTHDMVSLFHAMTKIQSINTRYPQADLFLAANLSPKNLLGNTKVGYTRAVEMIGRLLDFTKLPPEKLHIELSEDQVIHNTEDIQHLLAGLKNLGVEIVCDDFGKQYSNFDRLLQFPYFGTVKIDKLLTGRLDGALSKERELVYSVIRLLLKAGYTVCAEGVDSIGKYAQLRTVGCTTMQGYLIETKVSDEAFELFLVNNDFYAKLGEEALEMYLVGNEPLSQP